MMIARLPDPPQPRPDSTVEQYGLTLLQWLLGTPGACTVTMNDDQIATASYAGARASALRGFPVTVYDQLHAIRLELAATVERRIRMAPRPVGDPVTDPAGAGRDGANQGPMASLPEPVTPRTPIGGRAVAPVNITF